MAITNNLGVTLLETGQQQAEALVNDGFNIFDVALAGRVALDMDALPSPLTLTGIATPGTDQTNLFLNPFGNPGAPVTLIVQDLNKFWIVINDTDSDVIVKTAAGAGVTIASGRRDIVYCDSVNCHFAQGPVIASADQAAVADTSTITFSDPPTQAQCEALRDKCVELETLVNALRSALVDSNTIKGAA